MGLELELDLCHGSDGQTVDLYRHVGGCYGDSRHIQRCKSLDSRTPATAKNYLRWDELDASGTFTLSDTDFQGILIH